MPREDRELLFGRYAIGRTLGEGYFGRVYLAHDRLLSRDIAIKELQPEFLRDAAILRRFSDDARIAASIGHPNIVTVYNVLPESQPKFILMEFMPNGTLQRQLEERGKFSIDESLHVGLSLCHALRAAHGRGIVHRDIKPGDILLGDNGIIKLADFGLAHLHERYGGLDLPRRSHPHPCTPAYASPEQVTGGALDGRSDLYTLGVVLYELVTGSFYFERSTRKDLAACFDAVLNLITSPAAPEV